MKLAGRVTNIKASPTLEITAKAKALKASGIDVVSFGAGEPDYDTPKNIKDAAKLAIDSGFTKYTPVSGTDSLKDAIIDKLKSDNGLTYKREEIVVSCGAKHSLYNISQALFEEGDEVIIPKPYWVSYPDQVVLAGAKPVTVNTSEENNFLLTPDIFRESITDKTKAVILNSPSNPTGSAYDKGMLSEICEIALSKNVLIISDEIYEKIVFDDFVHISPASLSNEIKENTIVVNGVSKSHSMTGWRIGYLAGNKEIVSAVNKIQSQSTSNPTSISQSASVEALNGDQCAVSIMVAEFAKRRDYIVERLNSIRGVSCLKPKGAFYVFPNISGVFNKSFNGNDILSSVDFASYLLDEAGVALVPGIAFGMEGFVRLSYATSMENIEKGLDRISRAVKSLK